MRFMVMVPATPQSEAGTLPTGEEMARMQTFNEEMVKAGVMLSGDGLHASSKGARITFGGGGKTTVMDGPFTESKELVSGYWIIQVKSKEEAIQWMRRAPFPEGSHLDIRQMFDMEDFAPSDPTGELRANVERIRDEARALQSK